MKYHVQYQLGGRSAAYTSKRAAARALHSAKVAADKGGDCQCLWIEDEDGNVWTNGDKRDKWGRVVPDRDTLVLAGGRS